MKKNSFLIVVFMLASATLLAQIALPGGTTGITNNSPNTTVDINAETKIINTVGRNLLLERENGDSWLTFHDPGDLCYSMGIDFSDNRKFKINMGCALGEQAHFTMDWAGNIGIGTNSPLAKLHAKNGAVMASDISFDNINARLSGSAIPSLRFTRWTGANSDQHNAFIGQFFNPERSGEYSLGLGTGRSLSGDQDITDMVITLTLDGNVGVGTKTPDAKLTVKGDIHTREVRVDMAGSVAGDYVFEKDYNLLPLSELEAYINANKHLPEVPSANEFEANGLNLKEMNLILLKKVEELTLHLIEMKKHAEKQDELIGGLLNRTKN